MRKAMESQRGKGNKTFKKKNLALSKFMRNLGISKQRKNPVIPREIAYHTEKK